MARLVLFMLHSFQVLFVLLCCLLLNCKKSIRQDIIYLLQHFSEEQVFGVILEYTLQTTNK